MVEIGDFAEERRKKLNKKKILSIVLLILSVGCIIANVYVLSQDFEMSMPRILACVSIFACLSALYYVFVGFKKYAAEAYTSYMLICSLFCMLCTIGTAVRFGGIGRDLVTGLLVASNSMLFAGFLMLCVPKDFGKKNTYFTCIAILVIVVLQSLAGMIGLIAGPKFDPAYNMTIITRIFTKLVLALTAILMAAAKYIDKAERGTK